MVIQSIKHLLFSRIKLLFLFCFLSVTVFAWANDDTPLGGKKVTSSVPVKNNETNINQNQNQNQNLSKKPILQIQHWQTEQQLPVYFVETRQIPMLILNVIFSAGSAYDQQKWGLAELTANLLNQGTLTRNVDQIANALADSGAEFNASVNRDMAVVSLQSLSDKKYLQPALDIFIDILTQPNFPQDGFLRQQQLALASIKQNQEDPASVAMIRFYQTLYQQFPYAHPVDGTSESINKLTVKDAANFYHEFYGARNAKIVMVGDLSREQAEKMASEISSKLALGNPAEPLPELNGTPKAENIHINFPAKQTTALIGQLGIDHNDPDFFPLLVGNYVLGNLPLDSLLFQKVRREQGLAYSTTSDLTPYLRKGPFVIQLQTRAEKATEAMQIAVNTLKSFLKSGPSEEQLQLSKNLIINGFPTALATNQDISSVLTSLIFYNRPLNYLDTYRDKIRAVTAEEIKHAFENHIQPDKMITVTVGPIDPNNNLLVNKALKHQVLDSKVLQTQNSN